MHRLVPFFKFFLAPKNDLFSSAFLCDHYALVFLLLLHKLILLYFDSICTRLEKFLRKWTRKVCPKMRSTKDFWENSTRARCFAELFRHQGHETIYALVISKSKIGQKSSSRKMHDWVPKCAENGVLMCRFWANMFSRKRFCRFGHIRRKVFTDFGTLMCRIWANVFSRKRFCRFGHIRAWCLFLSWQAGRLAGHPMSLQNPM